MGTDPGISGLASTASFIYCCLSGAVSVLLDNNSFLRMIAKSSSIILDVVTKKEAVPTSLKERLLAYMHYKCPDKILRGVEKAAFQLHCSPRQLQRVLNELTDCGETEKIGKGAYRLVSTKKR